MAVTIIGASKPSTEEASPLAKIDQDLPPPATAPAEKRPLSDEQIKSLFAHEHPLVRAYGIEQASRIEGDAWSESLRALVDDQDNIVATDAIHSMEQRKYKPAAESILARFKNGAHEVAAVAASALGELAPERLLEAVKQRGRLDDEAYAATATALAIIGSNEVVEFLDKALNRSGALSPDRRGALFGAALLSGSPELCGRVLYLAVEDSKKEEPEGASYPSRGALAAIAGLPLPYSRSAAGLEVYDMARTELEATVVPLLNETDAAALKKALEIKRVGAIFAGLEPVLSFSSGAAADETLGSMPRRRRGLLRALIDKKDALEKLELKAAAVFLATAAQASAVVLAGEGSDATSPAIMGIAKSLETASIDAAALAAMSEDALVELFKERTERMMRRVHNILTHEQVRQPATLERFTRAIVRAGHAEGLFDAAADVEEPRIRGAVIEALEVAPDRGEKIVLEALSRTPMEPKAARLALLAAEHVRTERVALAIGRRFGELRAIARGLLVRAVLRIGDPRLIPLLEARAYPDEPEEVAWAVLSMVHGRERTPKLAKAIERTDPHRIVDTPDELRLPLKCKRCGETLGYGFENVLLDLEAKDKFGDPAFVGDTTCKACGVEDQLEPTEEAARILTSHMLEFVAESKRGTLSAPPRVSPAQTDYRGKKMGLAAAMRELDREVATSPDSIRARLHRARLRLVLKRKQIPEDLERVLAIDPKSPEALSLSAAVVARAGEHQRAMDLTAEAIRSLREGNARLYDAQDADAFRSSLEEYMAQLGEGAGAVVPADLAESIADARKRRAARAPEIEAAQAEAAAAADEAEHTHEEPGAGTADPGAYRAGRNDPCPCGSGKKFKKCHGKGR